MKKQFVAVLCTVLCVFLLLAGCGAGKEEQQETLSFEGSKSVENEPEEPVEPEPEVEPEEEEPEEPAAEPEEESEEEEVIEEDADSEAGDSLFAFEIDDPVIYDSEGVTVTMDGSWDPYKDLMELTFTMDNHNPDNKKVSFEASIYIDGFYFSRFTISGLAVDESKTQKAGGYLTEYFKLKEWIDADPVPIESLSINYLVQIGSDGKRVPGSIVFSNPEFTDAAFTQIYGDKIDEFDYDRDLDGMSDATCEVYVKHMENNYTLITMKVVSSVDLEGSFFFPGIDVYINDKWCSNYLFVLRSNIFHNGDMICSIYDTPENIRKEMEIPNDVPLEGYIKTSVNDTKGKAITIPVILE